MKRRASYIVVRTICLLVLASALAPASRAMRATDTKPAVDLRQSPGNGSAPVEVSVGLYITNFVAIDETRETFEVGGFLTGQWHDPRLVLREDQPQGIRAFRLEDLWAPAIEGANVISHKTNQYSLEADKNGTVTYRERFDTVYSNDFQLRKFPFDTQVLQFEYLPFLSSVSQIRFAPQALHFTGISPDQHTELAAWHFEDLRYTSDKVYLDPFQVDSREALFQLTATRRSAFYVWKIFLPLIMITLIPMVAFWIDVKEFDWILKIPMTMLLSMVAFQFTVTRDLPRIGYITFLDAVFLAGFVFCFLAVFEITLVFLLQKHGRRPLAVRLHSAGKWAYPLGYLGVLSILAIGFLA
jgi:Neurotransmitter-gated ion-channel ligand binding domain